MNVNLNDINLDTFSNNSLNEKKAADKSDKFDKILDKENDKEETTKDSKEEISEEELDLLYMHFLQQMDKSEIKSINNTKENIIKSVINKDDISNNENKTQILDVDIDIQYLSSDNYSENTGKNLDVEEIYDIELNKSKLESTINIVEDKNRINVSDELDILGQISALDSNDLFDKYKVGKSISDTSQVNTENKVNQEVINNIKFMKTEDIKELSIKLRPRELGDMNIKLMQENGTLKAVVSVAEKEVYDMISKNVSEIKQHLELFNVKEVSIVMESENAYSSDSFDKSFEEHQSRRNNEKSKKGKNENIIVNIDNKEEISKNEGINLLA